MNFLPQKEVEWKEIGSRCTLFRYNSVFPIFTTRCWRRSSIVCSDKIFHGSTLQLSLETCRICISYVDCACTRLITKCVVGLWKWSYTPSSSVTSWQMSSTTKGGVVYEDCQQGVQNFGDITPIFLGQDFFQSHIGVRALAVLVNPFSGHALASCLVY